MNSRIYSVCNQKGGVGKTVTTVNLGIGLAKLGKKVLVVDVDAQSSLTASLGCQQPDKLDVTLATLMECVIQDEPFPSDMGMIHHAEGIDLLPANIALSGVDAALVSTMSRETVLRRVLKPLRDSYDVILLDCMPSLSMLTINALAASDEVLIPVQPQYLAVMGLEQLIRTIAQVKRHINPALSIGGILVTMANLRTIYTQEIIDLLHRTYDGHVRIFESIIPLSIRAAETSAEGRSIYLHDPTGKVAGAYAALTREVAG